MDAMTVSDASRSRVRRSVSEYADQTRDKYVSAVLGPDTEGFDALQQAEADLFPEMRNLPSGNYAFWVVMRNGMVLHTMRLSFPSLSYGLLAPFQIHELVRSGQRTARQVAEEYERRGFDLAQLVSAETHFRVASQEEHADSVALPSYLGLVSYCLRTNRAGVLGHLNEISIRQFGEAGFEVAPASIEHEAYTPLLDDPSQPDPDYKPCLMPIAGENAECLKRLEVFAPEHLETYIDLRSTRSTPERSVVPERAIL